jgi:hypothetical protein
MASKRNKKKKVGRNEPCPCGSGKKYKKCHGGSNKNLPSMSLKKEELSFLNKKIEELGAEQIQREKQQGKGRPIISTLFQGYRIIAVGNRICYSKTWQTFHDFLMDYIKQVLGSEWGNRELKKELDKRHPILQWYDIVCRYQQKTIKQPGKVHTAPIIGAIAAYLNLSYNLYLLSHNAELEKRLIKRLKNNNIDQFFGAYYETYVAASFIKAGFDIILEDELDRSSKHCEFTATHKKSGRKFSVEAKARMPGKENAKVTSQLYKALKKETNYERIIFIDVNVPEEVTTIERTQWLNESISSIRDQEANLTIDGKTAPPAYLILTNHPYLYNLETANFGRGVLGEGFKIPDFRWDTSFENLRKALDSREKHQEVFDLLQSLKEHCEIPSTFDGEIPEFAFGEQNIPRLRIGQKYIVKDKEGIDVVGLLKDATVNEKEKLVYGVYQTETGQQFIATAPLTEEEFTAYKSYPDTFFGVFKKQSATAKDALDLYDFFYNCYQNTPKEKLLEFMKNYHNYETIKEHSQTELAKLYCENLTYSAMNSNKGIKADS